MMISIRYASHLPVLTKIVEETSGPILELGVGLYSTPYLHWKCFGLKRKLVSFESDPRWVRYFRDSRTDFHEIHLVEDWDKISIDQDWDVALIDHNPNARRNIEARRLADKAKYVVVHDTEPESEPLYRYSHIYPLFKYRFDYKSFIPHTTVLSNFVVLTSFGEQLYLERNKNFTEVVNKRFSIRQYQATPVPEKLVREIVELAKLAPSAGNLQAYKVYITHEKVVYDAPVSFVICTDPERSARRYGERGRNLYSIQDATIFASYLQLAIVNAGLASAWVGAFREGRVRELLKIPEYLKIVTVITAGYPIGEKFGRRRRSFDDIVSWQK